MATNIARFALLVLLALLAGTTFGIWAGYNPASLPAAAYVAQHQIAVRGLNVLLPAMGAVCIVLTVWLAVAARNDRRRRNLLALAALLMIAAALITRFGNQPINALVMTWTPQAPGANWSELREQWWQWHVVRTVAVVGAYAVVVVALVFPGKAGVGRG